jgi:competence ComEA-like helix-hairpin-helix protein
MAPWGMNDDERRALWVGTWVLLLASLVRFGWEVRPVPPLLPPDTTAYETLLPATEAAVSEAARRGEPLAPGERLDPNTASAVELDRLPGIGPALADRIVAFRQTGPWFSRAEELDAVAGVGPTLVERLRPHLAFGPPPAGRGSGGAPGAPARPGPGVQTTPLDLNRAEVDELQALPGVGPALARRIVDDRESRGPFASLDALERVRGIGPALVERMRGVAVVHP